MDFSKVWSLEKHLQQQSSDFLFSPMANIFENAVVFCYPKVGTRFFLFISNYPKSLSETYNQYILNFSYGNSTNERLNVSTLFNNYSVSINFLEEHKNTFDSYDSFFNSNCGNINNFLFDNNKDLYFVIREPKSRFLSGITQILAPYISELLVGQEIDNLKSLGNISDSEIENIQKNYNHYFNENDEFTEENLSNIDINIITKLIIYILKFKPELYHYDIHTQNYLGRYKELIYNVKNPSKVKIIDLSDCKKESTFKFFNNWSNSIDYTQAYSQTKGHIISNKKLYNHLIEEINKEKQILQSLYFFLASEYKEYMELKNSKYFVKL